MLMEMRERKESRAAVAASSKKDPNVYLLNVHIFIHVHMDVDRVKRKRMLNDIKLTFTGCLFYSRRSKNKIKIIALQFATPLNGNFYICINLQTKHTFFYVLVPASAK